MIKYTLRIGDGRLEFENADIKQIHKFGAIYGALPNVCDACQCADLYLSHKAPKENDYYMVACKKCGATLNLHEKKVGGFYVKFGEKMEVYVKNGDPTTPTAQHVADSEPELQKDESDDVPF